MTVSYDILKIPHTLLAMSCVRILLASLAALAMSTPCLAHEVNDTLSVGGIVAGAGQCQRVSARLPSDSDDFDSSLDEFNDECRAAMPVELQASFHPDQLNEWFLRAGFAAGNGLNTCSPWELAPLGGGSEGRRQEHQRTKPELSTRRVVPTRLPLRRRQHARGQRRDSRLHGLLGRECLCQRRVHTVYEPGLRELGQLRFAVPRRRCCLGVDVGRLGG